MGRQVAMSLLETSVFLDIVKIISSNHDRPLHFRLDHNSGKDSASDRHVSSEWAFLVDIFAVRSLK